MKLKNLITATLILALIFASVAGFIRWRQGLRLEGAFTKAEIPEFNLENWVSGSFQADAALAFNDRVGLRWLFIRWKNQLDYWLYGKSNHWSTIFGENGTLFPRDYYWSYTGGNFKGFDTIYNQIEPTLKFYELLQEQDKQMLIVLAPNKVRQQYELLPNQLQVAEGDTTNYRVTLDTLKATQLPVLDLSEYFLTHKDELQYPVFPQYGLHWNTFGMVTALQEIVKRLEQQSGENFINPKVASWNFDGPEVWNDADILNLMNLLFPPTPPEQPWPKLDFSGQEDARPLNALFIADSFFFSYYRDKQMWKIFGQETEFWYYNNTVYKKNMESIPADERPRVKAVEEADCVIFLTTSGGAYRFTQGFVHDYLEELEP